MELKIKKFEYAEEVKQAFLLNIGKVIKKHRRDEGLSQTDLSEYLGNTTSTIERYENAKTDISAGTMATISCILGFPMSEYIEDIENPKILSEKTVPIDEVFRKVISYAKSKRIKKMDDRPPKPGLTYNYKTGQWDIVERPPRVKEDRRFEFMTLNNILPKDIQKEFTKYMETPGREDKEVLLRTIYSMIVESEDYITDPGLKTLSKAVLDYVTNDSDKYNKELFRDYRRYIELLEEAERDFQD